MPTASAVVADIIDLAIGRAQRTFQTMRLWASAQPAISLRSASAVPSRFYLRLMIQDKPGVLAEIARILATRHISIASVMQHEALDDREGSMVPLVIMTHLAPTSNFTSTIHELDSLERVQAPCVYFPVGE
jgi:homoserine dehydrogenase